jgi:aryl-alcohol dehydrogenase-like predicted oxidoreductase
VAFAYAFSHPHLASILFGARSPEQLNHNVGAYATFTQLDDDQRAAIAAIAV